MKHWIEEIVFYHIYPLGLCAAPDRNDPNLPPVSRLEALYPWLDHMADLGCNGLYLGPLFESVSHGYDTTDYYHVDRRLGDNSTLTAIVARAHELGIKVVLDGVFNHVGRDFWAFRDVLSNRQNSAYANWFSGLRFEGNNAYNDGLTYDCWDGHQNLVKLNLHEAGVRGHLFGAVQQWMDDYHIDGLRLDAADVVDKDFLTELARFTKSRRPDFWLMGEVVHGDYRNWANPDRLDSVTNYECFKGLYSSFNDHNMFEISWSLNRQFGDQGMYRDLTLYNFADNHDVSRVASLLHNPANLLPLYTILFSMPGAPSIYYGSEFAVQGVKESGDAVLRPALNLTEMQENGLIAPLKRLIQAKKESNALKFGSYRQLHLANDQFAFLREADGQAAITVVNSADHAAGFDIPLPGGMDGNFLNLLNTGQTFLSQNGRLHVEMPDHSAMLLMRQ